MNNMVASLAVGATLVLAALAPQASAQTLPITPAQRDTAAQVAQRGVALAELAPSAPDLYTVKGGDTLWGISGLFLSRPWRWPELWGMNLQEVRNPHLIYPGQQLHLLKKDGRAVLSLRGANSGPADLTTVRVSPRTRVESLAASALPTLKPSMIEPFLAEPVVVDESSLQQAPRIVAARDQRVMLSKGDRAYGRGSPEAPLADTPGTPLHLRVVRNAVPLKDPVSGEILGYEAYYLGQAALRKGEGTRETTLDGKTTVEIVPASLDILSAKEEIRVGDRLLPEPPRTLLSYVPRAPSSDIEGRVVSIYGSGIANANAAQSQVVSINKGTRDGLESGHVLTLLSDGGTKVDATDPSKPVMRLPDESNGTLMVFRTFERVSYGLILDIQTGVKVGDRLITPR